MCFMATKLRIFHDTTKLAPENIAHIRAKEIQNTAAENGSRKGYADA